MISDRRVSTINFMRDDAGNLPKLRVYEVHGFVERYRSLSRHPVSPTSLR